MTLLVPSRRGFLTGLSALLAAPAIVRFSSLMPVRALPLSITLEEYARLALQPAINRYFLLSMETLNDGRYAWYGETASYPVLKPRIK